MTTCLLNREAVQNGVYFEKEIKAGGLGIIRGKKKLENFSRDFHVEIAL